MKKLIALTGCSSSSVIAMCFLFGSFIVAIGLTGCSDQPERWGKTQVGKQTPLAPETSVNKINYNIVQETSAIHSLIPDGQYGHNTDFKDSFLVKNTNGILLPLNKNYEVHGDSFEITFKVRSTPYACSESAHYWLDNGADEVNGFKPGGQGILASDVIQSCKNGELVISVH